MSATMNKGEREDLQRLVRQREKVLKSAAKQRTADLIADFEKIAARCKELGIPERFAPSISLKWHHRGYDNLVEARRRELRRMAVMQIEAIEQKAIVQIELSCLKAQEQIAMAGLTSDAAKQFITALPSVETLMPSLSFREIAGEADPPIADQLVSSNALRQRRFRERQKALQDASRNDAVTHPAIEAPDDDTGDAE